MPRFGTGTSTTRAPRLLFERTPKLDRVRMFGSRAAGKVRDNSDIDAPFDAPVVVLQAVCLMEAIQ